MFSIHNAIDQLFQLFQIIILVRILLTWFPDIKWWQQPFKFLQDVSDPVLVPVRNLIPPVGGFDLSPIVVFITLGFVKNIILSFI